MSLPAPRRRIRLRNERRWKADLRKEVLEARGRISEHIRETPVELSLYLGRLGNCRVHLKLESLQITGSFKLRGAMNKLLSLGREERDRGVVTASSGNHGAAFAYLLDKFGCRGTIFLPEYVSRTKLEALRLSGAELQIFGDDCIKAEARAKEVAERGNLTYISPYNDMKIIGGQGTVAVELEKQVGKMDAVLVPVGGGGLISGVAGYLKSVDEKIEIVGCQPENSAVMYESVRAGRILDLESKPTISDGTAGGIEQGAITFDICRSLVDDFVIVSEREIKEAIRLVIDKHQMLVEGAAALSVAAFVKTKERFENKNVVLILSGAKIDVEKLKEVLNMREHEND